MKISDRIFDTKTRNLYRNLCNKIATEHFNMTLGTDRNFNYLWFMYTRGVHAGMQADFIVLSEIYLLQKLGYLDQDSIDNIKKMLTSDDNDNVYIALMSIKTLRKQRIKKHGEFTQIDKVSPEFAEAAMNYTQFITPMSTKLEKDDKRA
jgi:hypothetical protein